MLDPEDLPLDELIEIEPGMEVERHCLLETAALARGRKAIPIGGSRRVGATSGGTMSVDRFWKRSFRWLKRW